MAEKEGPRSFARFVEQLDSGVAHTELSRELHELAAKLHQEAEATNGEVKGALILELRLAVTPRGTGAVGYSIKTKEPQKKHGSSWIWLTKGDNVSFEQPRQEKLPFRNVNADQSPARELEESTEPARSV